MFISNKEVDIDWSNGIAAGTNYVPAIVPPTARVLSTIISDTVRVLGAVCLSMDTLSPLPDSDANIFMARLILRTPDWRKSPASWWCM